MVNNSVLYGATLVVTRGLGFILLLVCAAHLGPEQFGLMEYFAVLSVLVAMTFSLELAQAIGRFVPEIREQRSELTTTCSTAIIFAAIVHLIVIGGTILFREEISAFVFSTPEHGNLLALSAVGQGAFAVVNVIMAQLRAELRPMDFVKLSMFNVTTVFVLTLAALLGTGSGLRGVLLAQLVANVASLALGVYLTRGTLRPTFSRSKLRVLLAFSAPLVPSGLGVVVAQYADRFVINDLMTLADVGIYGIGFRFSVVVMLAFFGLQYALTPMIYANLSDDKTPGRVALLFRHIFALSMLLFLNTALTAEWLIRLMAPDAFLAAATVIPILTLAGFFRASHIFAPGLSVAKKTVWIAVINVAAAVLNVILNYALIPHLGIVGAAVATLISTVLLFAAYVILGHPHYRIEFGWSRIAGAFVVTVGLVVVFQLSEWQPVAQSIYLLVCNAVLVTAFIALKIVDLAMLRKILPKFD